MKPRLRRYLARTFASLVFFSAAQSVCASQASAHGLVQSMLSAPVSVSQRSHTPHAEHLIPLPPFFFFFFPAAPTLPGTSAASLGARSRWRSADLAPRFAAAFSLKAAG